MNLKELLTNWEDQDISAYYLACCLGLIEYDSSFVKFRESKHIFWTKNSKSDFLYRTLQQMVDAQMLEFDDEETRYRWNKAVQ